MFCASFQGTFKKIWCALTSRWNLFLFFSFPCPFSPFSTSFFWAICLHKLSFHGDLEFFSLNFFLPIFILKLLEVLACFLFFCLCSLVACNFFKNVKVNLSTLVFALSLTIVSRALRLTSSVVTFQSLVVLSRVSKPIAKFHLQHSMLQFVFTTRGSRWKMDFCLHTPCPIDLQISTKLGFSFPLKKKNWPFFPFDLVNLVNKSFLLNLLSFFLSLLMFNLSLLFLLSLLSFLLNLLLKSFYDIRRQSYNSW